MSYNGRGAGGRDMPIQLKNINFSYSLNLKNGEFILNDLSLEIEDGEFVAVMGRTGSGKTTFLQLIAGLISPSTGQILIDGEDIHAKKYDKSALREKVGIVFQYPEYQLFESTVKKDVIFGLKHRGLSAEEKDEKAKAALELMGFDYEGIKDKSPLSLSGGEKRRVAVAGVIAAEPKILLLDEPIAGLDPVSREEFLDMIKKLNGRGVTVIMVSHNSDAVCEVAKRVLVFNGGKIICDGDAADVFFHIDNTIGAHVELSSCAKVCKLLSNRDVFLNKSTVQYGELLNEVKNYLYDRGSCI